jgi:hypothetical protein
MQQFEGCTGRLGRGRVILATGGGNAVNEPRPNTGTSGEYGIAHGCGKLRGTARDLGKRDRLVQCPLNSARDIHQQAPFSDRKLSI